VSGEIVFEERVEAFLEGHGERGVEFRRLW
jgi:hypothetical protein